MRIICLLLALFAWTCRAQAEDASVSATLSSATATVGESVELQVTMQGIEKSEPPQVCAEGLEINYNAQSSSSSYQLQGGRFKGTSIIIYTYTVLAQKEGTFTIPALAIDAGGKKLATQPLTLTVSNAPGGGGGTQENKFALAEWVLPKSTAYVGEAVPLELRLYVDSGIQCQLQQVPTISGEGFTVAKLPKPTVNKITKDGRQYDMVVFKTAITPVKAGKLSLPATQLNTVMVLPQQKRAQRPRFPGGFPDMFNDPFFSGAFSQQQQVVIRPDPIELEIKPLPLDGKPKDFSGAVGQFTMETKAAPLRVRAGDPVTITAVVKGVGSFDRMNAPVLAEEPGWRIYPPSGKFQADDEVGISGAKTFEIAAIPETAKTELPKVAFSFFNSSTEKYETLTADRLPLAVENAPVATPAPVVAAATPAATLVASPTPKASDIQYIRVDAGSWGGSFDPVWRTRDFWLAQLVPLSALLALSGWQWRRVRQSDGAARRASSLRQSKATAFRVLRQEKTPTDAFYSAAIRIIQLETALGKANIDPATVDAEAACASRPLDCETAEGICRVFAAHDELRYAGVGGSGGSFGESIHPDQRERVLQILAQFEKNHV